MDTTSTEMVNVTNSDESLSQPDQKSTDKYYVLIVNSSSNRCVRLLSTARLVLLSLSIWQLVLILSSLFAILESVWRKPNELVIDDRKFYWLSFLEDILIFIWSTGSISTILTTEVFILTNEPGRKTVTKTTKQINNTSSFTMFGIFALILIIFEILLFTRSILFIINEDPSMLNGFGWQETSHLLTLSISRIICFLLWIFFMNSQLSLIPWSKDQFELSMEDPMTEEITLNPCSPIYIGRIRQINR
ncbi:hypothetical protein DERP_014135 [Dermatophagoides pteronyssinus]|uniref:Transmembrane protein n=1 Tax=Dermatophagoides pteronyssinus TaxID=6956 RepID=A0ABQ8IXC4_DERPT|nr:hypothetical protein DERP_014135 [Dermatophagoides pteronyssinus]